MKKSICILAVLMLLVSLVGCGQTPDEVAYTEAALKLYYAQDYEDYCAFTGIPTDEAETLYEDSIAESVAYFKKYFALSSCTEQTEAEIADIYRTLYQKADYKIDAWQETENGFEITLSIAPILFIEECKESYELFCEEFVSAYQSGETEYKDKTAYLQAFSEGVVKRCQEQVDDVSPSSERVSLEVSIIVNDESYTFADNGKAFIDTIIIPYTSVEEE